MVDAALRADWRPPVIPIGVPSHAIFSVASSGGELPCLVDAKGGLGKTAHIRQIDGASELMSRQCMWLLF